MTTANVRSTLRRANVEIAAFSAWWLQELRDSWLAIFERLASRRSQRFILDLSADTAILRKVSGGSPQESMERPFAFTGKLPPLQQIWPEGAPQRARVTVILPQSSVLLCHLRVPPVSDWDLAHVVELQLEREAPLPREQLYVDWQVVDKLPDQSRTVAVAIARRTYLERLCEAIRSWGWQPVAMRCRTNDSELLRFNLLPRPIRRLSFDIGKRERRLTYSTLALCAAYALITGGQWWYERWSLREPLERARSQAASLSRERNALSAGVAPLVSLHELMRTASASDALVAMTSAMPDDTWVYQADIRAGAGVVTLVMEGYTPAATSLLEMLEQSAPFVAIELVETTSGDAGLDRFEIKARLRTGERS